MTGSPCGAAASGGEHQQERVAGPLTSYAAAPPRMSKPSHTRAVAEAIFLREAGLPPADRLDWLCDDFDDFLEQAGPRSELVLKGALFVATWIAPLAIRRRPPLSRLPARERCDALEAVEQTQVGLPILALKAVLCSIYYEHPDSLAEIDVDGGCLRGGS